jgi:tetratricopeptide (TPR) repeat protein
MRILTSLAATLGLAFLAGAALGAGASPDAAPAGAPPAAPPTTGAAGEGAPGTSAAPAAPVAPAAPPAGRSPMAGEGPAEGPRSCAAEPEPATAAEEDPAAAALRHYVRGRLLMAAEDFVAASRELRQAAALAPDVHRIWLQLGRAVHDAGDAAGAIAAFETALRLSPDDPATLYFLARVKRERGEMKPSADLLDHLMTAAPKDSPYLILGTYRLAQTRQELGDIPAAIAQYESLVELLREPQGFYQRYPEIYLLYRSRSQIKELLGRLCLVQGEDVKAIGVFLDAMADRPDDPNLLALVWQGYFHQKDYASARQWAKKLIEVRPQELAGYERLAKVYAAEGNPQGVIADLEAYRRAQPGSAVVAFQLAGAYQAHGRRDEAVAVYRAVAAQGDKSEGAAAQAAMKMADLEVQAGRPVEALEALAGAMGGTADSALLTRTAQLLEALPDPARVYSEAQRLVGDDEKRAAPFLLVGMLAENLKRPQEAIALYDKAIARDPKGDKAYSRKADLLIAQGRQPDALAVYEAAVKAGADTPAFHCKRGMILEYLDRLDEALAQYEAARRGAPGDKITRYLLAGALARVGRLDDAEKELRGILARFPKDAQALGQLAVVRLVKRDLAGAEESAARALVVDGAAVTPRSVIAEIRYRQRRFDEAEQMARAILADHAEAADVRMILAYTLAGEKRFKDAAAEVKTLLAAEPENIPWRYTLAGLYMEMGDAAAAEQELQQILRKKPGFTPAHNDLGYLWADRGVNLQEAEQLVREAVKAAPRNAAYMDSLGWVMYKQGRFAEAAKALQQATEWAPDLDPVAWDHLGDACWRLARPEDATKAWQAAAKILQSLGAAAKEGELQRVQKKLQSAQAGQAPQVAPLPEKKDSGPAEPKAAPAPQP